MLVVVHQDDDLLVLNKASGVSVLADRSGARCLWDAVKERFPNARLVHRIDKGTSGLFLVALSQRAQSEIARAFNRRTVRKHYLAVVAGHIASGTSLRIALPLKRGRKNRYRIAGLREEIRPVREGWRLDPAGSVDRPPGLDSTTRIRVLRRSAARSLLAVQPLTGRSHQIRVHLAWIGHAIVGDHLYGAPKSPEQAGPRLALHAHRLAVPGFGTFKTAPPAEFFELVEGP